MKPDIIDFSPKVPHRFTFTDIQPISRRVPDETECCPLTIIVNPHFGHFSGPTKKVSIHKGQLIKLYFALRQRSRCIQIWISSGTPMRESNDVIRRILEATFLIHTTSANNPNDFDEYSSTNIYPY